MTLHCNLCALSFELLSLNMQLPIEFFTVLLNNLFYMITCKSFRIFYEPEDARWSSSENLLILIDTTFRKNELLVLLFILKLYARIISTVFT